MFTVMDSICIMSSVQSGKWNLLHKGIINYTGVVLSLARARGLKSVGGLATCQELGTGRQQLNVHDNRYLHPPKVEGFYMCREPGVFMRMSSLLSATGGDSRRKI